jgi:hypothetical protein
MELHEAVKRSNGSHARGIGEVEEKGRKRKGKEERGRHRSILYGGGIL